MSWPAAVGGWAVADCHSCSDTALTGTRPCCLPGAQRAASGTASLIGRQLPAHSFRHLRSCGGKPGQGTRRTLLRRAAHRGRPKHPMDPNAWQRVSLLSGKRRQAGARPCRQPSACALCRSGFPEYRRSGQANWNMATSMGGLSATSAGEAMMGRVSFLAIRAMRWPSAGLARRGCFGNLLPAKNWESP